VSDTFRKQESKPLGSAQSVDVKFEDCWALIAIGQCERAIKWCTLNNIFEVVRYAQQILSFSNCRGTPILCEFGPQPLDQEFKSYLTVSLTANYRGIS
jgi:hypothetical protein